MSFTLRAALGFRSRMGPRAGLAVLRPLIDQLGGHDHAQAILAALECARELSDEETYEALLARWVSVNGTAVFEPLAKEVGAAREFSQRLARELAQVECIRSPGDARAHYLLARVSPADVREATYSQALLLASRPPIRESYVAQIVASMISAGLDPGQSHVSSLAQEHVERLSARSQIAIARYRLGYLAGYRRVAVLDALLEHERGGPDAALAMAVVAEFANRQLPTGLEWDRLSTMAAAAGDETKRRFEMWRALREGKEGGSALARAASFAISATAVSKDASSGSILDSSLGAASKSTSIDAGADEWAWPKAQREAARDAYDAIIKLRRGESVDFVPFTARSASAGAPALALCALGLSEGASEAARFAESLVEHSPARRGWLRLSKASAGRGLESLASRLLERAFEGDEPGAQRALGCDLRRRAWALGDSEEALALMVRARRLLGGPA
jgi:hypothetical protein